MDWGRGGTQWDLGVPQFVPYASFRFPPSAKWCLLCSPQVLNRFPIGAHFMSIFLFFGASSLPLVHTLYIYVPWQLWHIYVQLVIDFEILISKNSIFLRIQYSPSKRI
jgi:hypothetical protein